MARRDPFTRPITIALGSALLVGAIAGTYKLLGAKPARHAAATTTQPANSLAHATTEPAKVAVVKPLTVNVPTAPTPAPVMLAATTTQPAMAVVPAMPVTPATTPLSPAQVKSAFSDADAAMKADDLLAARTKLLAAVDSKQLDAAAVDEAYKRLSEINQTVLFSPRKFVSDPWQTSYAVQPGDRMQKIANTYDTTVGLICRINNISDPARMRAGQSLKIIKGPFNAVVNKTAFTLDIYLGKPGEPGSMFVKRFRVGLGENDSTPTGLWQIGTKLINPKYYNSRNTGPRTVESGAADNPLGDRWLALEGMQGQAVGKTSYGIHGTIDPASIGQMKSMGCIRMLNEDVEFVYDLLITHKSCVVVTQ